MTTIEDIHGLLEGPLAAVVACDPTDPEAAVAALTAAYPPDGEQAQALREALTSAVAQGVICDRGTNELKYSRVIKPSGSAHGHSVDVVWMAGAGPGHRHVRGEMNLCFAVEGEPTFDGHGEGWVVFPPGSAHVPTVKDGRMVIAYFLPGGEMEWL